MNWIVPLPVVVPLLAAGLALAFGRRPRLQALISTAALTGVFAASVALPLALVNLFGLAGAVASYLAVMALLLCLLVWQYAQIRKEITRRADPFA